MVELINIIIGTLILGFMGIFYAAAYAMKARRVVELEDYFWTHRQKMFRLINTGNLDTMFDVNRFNIWFNKPGKKCYANSGIFLRLDKFSQSMIKDYIEDEFEGLLEFGYFPYKKIKAFEDAIREDWKRRINENDYSLEP